MDTDYQRLPARVGLAAVLIWVAFLGAAQAASVFYVALSGNGSDGSDWDNAYTNLQSAINASYSPDDLIYVKYGRYVHTGELTVSNHPGLTIRGGYAGNSVGGLPGERTNAATVLTRDSAANIRILSGTNSTFTLDTITVTNGAALEGAGLYLANCTATLTNCVVAANAWTAGGLGKGAGICIAGGNFTMLSSELRGNRLSGDALTKRGGGLYSANAAVTIADCTLLFNNIVAYDYQHGACLYLSGGSANIRNCFFLTNYFSGNYESWGAAINAGDVNPLLVSNCTFKGNFSSSYAPYFPRGTALYLNGASLTAQILDCLITENYAGTVADNIYLDTVATVLIKNTVIRYGNGRGIYKKAAGVLGVTNCLFTAMASHGLQADAGATAIGNCTFVYNGGLGLTNAGTAIVMLQDSIAWDNALGGYAGGGITSSYSCAQESHAGDGNFTNAPRFIAGYYLATNSLPYQPFSSPCIDAGSAASSALGLDARTTRTDGAGDGDMIDLGYHYAAGVGSASNLVLYVDPAGGDDAADGWTPASALKTLTNALAKALQGSTVNLAAGSYNAASGETFPLTIPLPDMTIRGTNRDATLVDAGGVGRVFQTANNGTRWGAVWIEGITITNGSAPYDGVSYKGSGLYLANCNATVTNCLLTRNAIGVDLQSRQGGAIYANNGTLNLLDSIIRDNGPFGSGSLGGTLNSQGAGLFAYNMAVAIDNAWFDRNRVDGYDNTFGGCMFVSGGSLRLRNSLFTGNYSRGYAASGVLHLEYLSALSISNCTFTGNKASTWILSGIVGLHGTGTAGMRIEDCIFTNNCDAMSMGSDPQGQIMVNLAGGSLALRNCAIGRGRGAGIYKHDTSTCQISLSNCLIFAQTNYGALLRTGTVAIANCTFADNRGFGVSNRLGSVTVSNSIAWGNSDGGLYNCAAAFCDSQEIQAGAGNTNVNPDFADAFHYHLASRAGHYAGGFFADGAWTNSTTTNSPLIDAGDPSAPWQTEEQPNGRRINMGAYANTPVASKTFIAEPGIFTNLRVHAYAATNLGPDSACFNGEVLATGGGGDPQTYFCWGPIDASSTDTGLWANVIDLGTRAQWELFSTNVTGLSGTTYYRAYVTNSAGSSFSSNAIAVTILQPPTVTNNGATDVRRRSAILQGAASDTEQAQPYCWFYYWTNNASVTDTVAVGQQSAFFSTTAAGLAPGVPYYFNILASNNAGITWSDVKSFTPFDTAPRGWYVATNGANDGGSDWTLALTNIYDALGTVEPGDTIYLAGQFFSLTNQLVWPCSDLTIQGGFAATNAADQPGPADLLTWPTILARIDGQFIPNYRVAVISNKANATLDRVICTGGELSGDGTTQQGAGLCIVGATNVSINRCWFTNNYSGSYYGTFEGSGLYIADSSGAISNCNIMANTIERWYPNTGFGEGHGAGLCIRGGNLTVKDSVVRLNSFTIASTYSYGSGIYVQDGQHQFHNCLLVENHSGGTLCVGAGLFATGAATRIQLENCTIAENVGKGLAVAAATAGATNCLFWNNADDISGSVDLGFCDSQDGDGAPVNGNFAVDPRLTSGYYLAPGSACIDNGNTLAAALGLDAYTTRREGVPDDNTVDIGYHYPTGVVVADLYVKTDGDDYAPGTDWGSALRTIGRALELATDGSHIHIAEGTYSPIATGERFPLMLQDNDLCFLGTNRDATVIDAAYSNRIFAARNRGRLRFEGLSLLNGVASQEGTIYPGGGLSAYNCAVVVTNCLFARNGSLVAPRSYLFGGAICAQRGTLWIFDCDFMTNGAPVSGSSYSYGGAVYVDNALAAIDGALFKGNAIYGYDFANGAALYCFNDRLVLRNLRFADNWRIGYHRTGVAHIQGPIGLSISNCLFANNSVSTYEGGGALWIDGSAIEPWSLQSVGIFTNISTYNSIYYAGCGHLGINIAAGKAALWNSVIGSNTWIGVYKGGAGALGMTNCLVFANTNHGVTVTAGALTIGNTTIADNGGWGISNSAGAVSIKNTIVWSNGLGGVTNCAAIFSDIQGGLTGNGNISLDPKFNAWTPNNYHLRSASPCINTGTNEPWMAGACDLDDLARLSGGQIDMGPYESLAQRSMLFSIR